MMPRWRGRQVHPKPEQVANACDDFVDLAPADLAPAEQVRNNWSALRAGQDIPLIGERTYGDEEEC